MMRFISSVFFFFNSTASTEIYTLSLHDALPIQHLGPEDRCHRDPRLDQRDLGRQQDRKSTRLNSSHEWISYAVFCLKKNIHPTAAEFIPTILGDLAPLAKQRH